MEAAWPNAHTFVFFISPQVGRDAFMHHTMHVLDAP